MIAVLVVFWPPIVSWIVSTIFGFKNSSIGVERLIRFVIFSVIFGSVATVLLGGIGAGLSTVDGGESKFFSIQDYFRLTLIFSALNFPFMYFGVFLKRLFSLSKEK